MKRSSLLITPLFVSLTALAGGSVVLMTGCASTSTQTSFGETVDDGVITTKVKAAFVEDKTVSALNISVETFKGTVQLSGFANNAEEAAKAVSLARNVKGVKAVKNDIRLKPNNG
jgi:hyperosmotically inducible protein